MKFENDIMSEIHQKLLTKYKGELKLPSSLLVFTDHCSNKLIRMMTDEDKILKDVKKWGKKKDHWIDSGRHSNGVFI